MELVAKNGRGYAVADSQKEENAPVGTIFVDSIYSPVRKVNHVVTDCLLYTSDAADE